MQENKKVVPGDCILMQGNVQHCTPASAAGEFRCMLYIALQRNSPAAGVVPDSANDVQWRLLDVLGMFGEFLAITAKNSPSTSTPAFRWCLEYLVVRMLEFEAVEKRNRVPLQIRRYINSSRQPTFAPLFDELQKEFGKKK
jgi:hypothetical protein